ncbi:HAD family hydrolase [Jannaschia aquimarina]|uniref:Phosphorylated carbohydrates phosphatase n=1 Tax=Jannaschia aquimarina TaxID=935700 RepID=A0A0D1EIN2_9RHOB|nr:HAD family phosphatase [Jannaschia aquimarina]KIT17489.1 Phosphorylated carbohydrates phosphatase [Jannaschia aquimarina]SNS74725.1 haloacid dehalogenase superfamily, subfamily IA, variant 3 with third motif having DD or ED [Jannaschia aquimarina]
MSRPRIEAVVFDMDGLLLDSEGLYREGFRRARTAMDLPPDDDLFHSLIGTNHESGGRMLRDAMGEAAEPFTDAWHRENAELLSGPIPLKPTVRACVEALSAAGVPVIVATSTRREIALRRLEQAGLADHLPDLVGGDQVSRGKPHPEIYVAAAARLSIGAEMCAAFEDSANGVRSAVAAGMVVTQVPDLVPPTDDLLALGHRVAPDLHSGLRALGLL